MNLKLLFISFVLVFIVLFFIMKQDYIMPDIYYYNRKNKLVKEKVDFPDTLKFLYNNSLGKLLRKMLVKRCCSVLVGWYNNLFISKFKINSFIKKHNINESEFLLSKKKFKNFNDFFTRKLKTGARKIDFDPNIIVSPADSKLYVIPDISLDIEFFIKNKKFNLFSFLKDSKLVQEYKDGAMFVFRLAPSDYHRYHFPFNCFVNTYKTINGIYDSVNPIAYKSGVQPLYENHRELIFLDSDLYGRVLFVSVGAMFVGKIVNTYKENYEYKKGDEMGYFEFGGSTIVILFKKGKVNIKKRFIEHSRQGYETSVLMGQPVTE